MSMWGAESLERFNAWMPDATDNHAYYVQKWRKYEQIYEGNTDRDVTVPVTDQWRSRLRFMFVKQQLATLEARLVKGDPSFDVLPIFVPGMNVNKAVEDSEAIEKAVNAQMYHAHFSEIEKRIVKPLLRLGCMGAKGFWDDETVLYHQMNPETMMVEPVTKNMASILPITPYDLIVDPAARVMDEARYIIHVTYPTTYEIEKMRSMRDTQGESIYKNLDRLPGPGGSTHSFYRSFSETAAQRKARQDNRYTQYEVWDFERNQLSTILGDNTVIRDEPIPFAFAKNPFVMFNTDIDPNSVYGNCDASILDHIQEEYQSIENALMDAIKLRVKPPVAIRMGSGAEDVIFEPGAKYEVEGDPRAAIQLMQTDFDISAAREILEKLKSEGEYLTGISSTLAGTDNSSTATGTQTNMDNSMSRVSYRQGTIDDSWARCFDVVCSLNKQFAADDAQLAIPGEAEPVATGRALFDQPVMFRAKAMSERQTASRKLNDGQLVLNTLIPLMGAPVFEDGSTVSLEPALELVADSMGRDVAEFKGPPPPPPPPEPAPAAQAPAQDASQQAQPGVDPSVGIEPTPDLMQQFNEQVQAGMA